jgi:ribonuclease HII
MAEIASNTSKRSKANRNKTDPLNPFYNDDDKCEIGVDEVGRGPMLGRVYTAAVVLPKGDDFNHSWMKDSKRFSSKKKITEVAEYIKENAVAYSITYESEEVIDNRNIRQAVLSSMHNSIKTCLDQLGSNNVLLLIDGNDFKPYMQYNKDTGIYSQINNICIEGGDNKYTAIAAASILAKVARDAYIEELCNEYPMLDEKYGIMSNKGYGTKKHMDGIKEHGITAFHRRTYGICRNYTVDGV